MSGGQPRALARAEAIGLAEVRLPPNVSLPEAPGDELGAMSAVLFEQLARLQDDLTSMLELLAQVTSWDNAPARPAAAPVEVWCLGSFRCNVQGTALLDWHSGRARSLFQYLLTHHDRPVPRDTLLTALWPSPRTTAPRTSLKVALHALRHTLAEGSADEATLGVEVDGSSYRLNASGLWIDVEEFERCYTAGRSLDAQGRQADALVAYARAAALYRGDFLEDVADEWPIFRREALIDQLLHVLAALADDAFERHDYAEAIARCQQMLAKDPCREDSYRLLMACHGRLGQRTRVRAWYLRCVTMLRDVLDVSPDDETDVIYRQALAGAG